MSDKEPLDPKANETGAPPSNGAAADEATTGPTVQVPVAELEALKAKAKESHDRYLRSLADFDNYQKRTKREMERFREDAVRDLLKDLVFVIDNFDFALQSAKPADGADPKATLETFAKGVALVRDQFLRLLAQRGVEPLGTKPSDPFDSERHEAVMAVDEPGLAKDAVGMVAREGYKLGSTILRPAAVQVKKAAPAQPSS